MGECACGCNEITRGGIFVPGHDQKLRIKLEGQVGGLRSLCDLVSFSISYANDELSLQEFGKKIKYLFQSVQG